MYVGVQFKLQLNSSDRKKLLELMRKQSSAIRSAYKLLKDKNSHNQIYQKLRQLFPDLPTKYIDSAIYKAKQYPTDKKVVFGGKALFEKLCKNRDKKSREKLKRMWKELRQGTLISVGSKADKGNRLLRFESINGELLLRITVGERKFIYAKVLREPSNAKDKWNTFLTMLQTSWQSKVYFPYTVELKLRDGEIYGSVSFEVPTPEVWLTKEYGVIAIDTNASPLHLALAEVSPDGNLLSYQNISLHELIGLSKNKKEYQEWLIAHKVVEIAKEKGKAIAIENLKKINRGYRGDGKAKLRKRLHHWNFKSLLSKIERTAKLSGIEVIKVNPAFTSVIGALKYAPQFGIDKDIASAYVIGRRALGFKEEVPENYLKLLSDREYLEYAIYTYQEKEKELKEQFKKETNQYKRNAINSELKQVQKAKDLLLEKLKSLQGEPSSCEAVNGRNPKQGEVAKTTSQSAWQVLKSAFLFPVLGKVLPRDLSPLKPLLVEGAWNRVRRRLVPLEVGGTPR
ncbi:IS200/IS605 family accessory protein TnpB-related protein [Thermocrinis jamiesonii]|uniref:IS200/IS605 family accessory protein TnpB-related protein n=1 Tax=Thermocrinis jamiesonii TaxID=1302351 RepID=UPI000496FAB9|nr:IS200/IS605 family accessory protein TnpB-related protein [Thermocrinis jamiesonii]